MPEKATIGLDYSHNNKLTLESSSFNEFTQFLFSSGYKLGKIQAGFDSLKKLETYDAIILSTPNNRNLDSGEIEILEKYVKKGGNLLIVSSIGGDHTNKTNLNELSLKFGFEFVSDEINDSMNYINLQRRPILTNFIPHVITEQVKKVIFSSACSINIFQFLEEDINIKVEEIVKSGLNCWHRIYNEEKGEWIEEDYPKMPLIVAIEYHKGKVVGFGNLSMFSSLGREYGFSAFDNDILIANILQWLTLGAITEGKVISVSLNLDLFYWVNKIMKEDNWESVSDIINVSLKYFKDNYKVIINEIKRQKLELKKAYQRAKEKKIKVSEEDLKILELVPVRKKEDLEDIMSALEELTGEKYEISIDLGEEDEEFSKEILEEKKEKKLEYTEKDIKKYQKETGKNAIWRGKLTKGYKEWLNKKKKS
jgi:Arc/MetJ-type ribon-helix-helix transcriptional regulator